MSSLAKLEVELPVITSYVNANVTAIPKEHLSLGRRVYANAWVDVYSEDFPAQYNKFVATIDSALEVGAISADEAAVSKGAGFAYALAGYIAAETFIAGLNALGEEDDITWANYIKALESKPHPLPFTNGVDFTEGKRWGIDQLVLTQRVFITKEVMPDAEADYDGFIRLTKSAERHDVRKELETIDMPTLIISSKQDYLTPIEDQYYLAERMPNADHITIENAGHASMYERL
ncbi:MAG: alpha/beta hydrolase [Bacilli bacterium]